MTCSLFTLSAIVHSGHLADCTISARYKRQLSSGNSAARHAAIWLTFGVANDVPTVSAATPGPPFKVDRTNSGQTSLGEVILGGIDSSFTKSPPYSTTSGLIVSQIPNPEHEKADGLSFCDIEELGIS